MAFHELSVRNLILISCIIFFSFTLNLSAQWNYGYGDFEDLGYAIEQWDEYEDAGWVYSDVTSEATAANFINGSKIWFTGFTSYLDEQYTIHIKRDGKEYTFNLDESRIYFDDTDYDDWEAFYNAVLSDPYYRSYLDWFMEAIGYGGLSGGGVSVASPVPADPVVGTAIASFKNQVFSEPVKSRVEKQEEETRVMVYRNEMNSDFEYESFDGGSNLALRAGYGFTNDSKWTYGGLYYYNRLSFDNSDSYNNHTVSFFLKKGFAESENSAFKVGFNVDYLNLDASDDDGVGFGASMSGTHYVNDNQINWGGMYQATKIGDITAQFLMGGLMWGIPVGEKLTIMADMLGTYTLSVTDVDDIDDPFSLMVGGYLGIYISPQFSLTTGVKSTFLIEGYEPIEIVLGAGWRF